MTKAHFVDFSMEVYEMTKDVVSQGEIAIIDAIIAKTKEQILSESFAVQNTKTGQTAIAAPADAMLRKMMFQTMDGCVQLVSCALWAHAGFPQVSMGHKYAAALLVTEAPAEAIEACRPPFPAFLIEVPDGLLWVVDPKTKEPDPIRRVMVAKQSNPKLPDGWGWAYTAYSSMGTLFRYGVSTAELLPPWIEVPDVLPGDRLRNNDTGPNSFELTEQDARMTAMIGRLIVNVCLAFSDPTTSGIDEPKVRRAGTGTKARGKNRKHDEPVVRVYEIGHEVNHDFRQHVREYAAGTARKLTVQSYVHGYWRRQAHGPRLSLRTWKWIEPYWKGPDTAPIAARPHRMG